MGQAFFELPPPRSNGPAVPKAANVDLSRFKVLLAEEPAVKCIPRPLASVVSIDNQIDLLCRAIAHCAISCRVCSVRTPGSRNMPWWSSELCAARSKVRKAYKLWSVNKSDENRSSYIRLKAAYQRALRLAKESSYKSFQANSSTSDDCKALKSFAGKTKNIPLPYSLLVDGNVLTDPLSINKACANHFFLNPTTSLP